MKVTKDKWIWFPHPAHFICSYDCQFFMATKVGKFIVSTVGEYNPDSQIKRIYAESRDPEWYKKNMHEKGDAWHYVYNKKFGFEDLHHEGWKYETMVFKAQKSPKETKCCSHSIVVSEMKAEEWYKTAEEAYKGHMKLCAKFANK